MSGPVRSAIIRRMNETTNARENHGIEEDFFNRRVTYINRITDPPGYSPHGYKASQVRRNSKLWISVGFFCTFQGKACFLSGLYREVKKEERRMPERKIKVKSGRYETWMEVSEEIVEQQNLLKVLREALDRLMTEEKELAVKVIGDWRSGSGEGFCEKP